MKWELGALVWAGQDGRQAGRQAEGRDQRRARTIRQLRLHGGLTAAKHVAAVTRTVFLAAHDVIFSAGRKGGGASLVGRRFPRTELLANCRGRPAPRPSSICRPLFSRKASIRIKTGQIPRYTNQIKQKEATNSSKSWSCSGGARAGTSLIFHRGVRWIWPLDGC